MLSGRELETEEILVMVNSAFGGTLAFRASAHRGVPAATSSSILWPKRGIAPGNPDEDCNVIGSSDRQYKRL